MINTQPIYCPHCGCYITDESNLMYLVMPIHGLVCPRCDKIAIYSGQATF